MIVTIKSTTWITVCLFELISICTLKCNYQWCNMWFRCMSTSSRYPSIFLSRSFSSSYSLILPRSVSVYLSRLYYHISTFFFIWIFFYLDVMFDLYVIIVSSFFYIIRFFISKEISIHSYISLFLTLFSISIVYLFELPPRIRSPQYKVFFLLLSHGLYADFTWSM